MASFALENLVIVAIAIAFSFLLIEFDSDPISGVLAFDFTDELDDTLLAFPFERD